MKKKYLNAKRKAYYLAQMQLARELPDVDDVSEFGGWKMDSRLESDFQRINRFDCMQTMYSRLPYNPADVITGGPCYIQVALAERMTDAVLGLIERLQKELTPNLQLWGHTAHSYEAPENHPEAADITPAPYSDLDMIVRQNKYLSVENAFFFFSFPVDRAQELMISEFEDYDILEEYNRGWEAIIDGLEKICEDRESESNSSFCHSTVTI